MTVLERIALIQRATAQARRQHQWESEFGWCEDDYTPPPWLDLPAQRALFDHQQYPWGESEPWQPDPPAWMTETCPHGLSAWLCADPINHYPSDHTY